MHYIPFQEEEEKEHMNAHFGDVARLYDSCQSCIILV